MGQGMDQAMALNLKGQRNRNAPATMLADTAPPLSALRSQLDACRRRHLPFLYRTCI